MSNKTSFEQQHICFYLIVLCIPNSSWRFVDSDHEYFDVEEPFPYPEVLEYAGLIESIDYAGFVAVKIGDVNQSYNPQFTGVGTADVRSNDDYVINISQVTLEDDKVRLEFRASETGIIKGLQVQISSSDPISAIHSGSMDITSSNMYQPKDKEIRIAWNHLIGSYVTKNEILFTIDVKTTEITDRDIQFIATQMRPEIYT